MARRRYQKGTLILRGKRGNQVWVGRWLEDELLPDGTIKRRHKSEVLGSLKDFATKRLAQRELDKRLTVVNSPSYRARPTATFRELSDKWKVLIMPNHEASTQNSEKSDIKAWCAALGDVQVRDIDAELLQEIVSGWKTTRSPKTIRNRFATFRLIWDTAKVWKYTTETVYDGVVIPNWNQEEQPHFTTQQVAQIVQQSPEPYSTLWMLDYETGMRRGELCGLNVGDVDLDKRVVVVRRSVTKKRAVKGTKSGKPRGCSISPQMVERLRLHVEGRDADAPLFLSAKKARLEPENLVRRHLKPVLTKLGLKGGAHGFRHGNASLLDSLNAPMAIRQGRLGHVDSGTTMQYTHRASADEIQLANAIGAKLEAEFSAQILLNLPEKENGLQESPL